MPRLADQTVLVTGASKGIGRALALGCAREGAHVILNYHTDRAGAEAAAVEIRALGRRALVVRANLAQVAQIDRMFATARRHFPRLDVLINNAGLTGWTTLFETTAAKWDVVLDTNLRGTFFCSLAAARWMRDTRTAGADALPLLSVTVNVMVCTPSERSDMSKAGKVLRVPSRLEVQR